MQQNSIMGGMKAASTPTRVSKRNAEMPAAGSTAKKAKAEPKAAVPTPSKPAPKAAASPKAEKKPGTCVLGAALRHHPTAPPCAWGVRVWSLRAASAASECGGGGWRVCAGARGEAC